MTKKETELQELLRQGTAAARVGERDAAQEAFRRATELVPGSEEAWLGLAGAVESLAEKRACFERVLEINPGNVDAQTGLSWVARKDRKHEPGAQKTEEQIQAARDEDEAVYCFYHPNVETGLRCNKCGKPICVKCARRTPVGYRCPDCIRSQQAVFYSAGWLDYMLVVVVGIVASFIGAAIIGTSIWLAVFLGPVAGAIIAEAARWAARRRRGRYMAALVSSCIVIGALPTLLFVSRSLWGLGGLVIYVATAIGTAYARLR